MVRLSGPVGGRDYARNATRAAWDGTLEAGKRPRGGIEGLDSSVRLRAEPWRQIGGSPSASSGGGQSLRVASAKIPSRDAPASAVAASRVAVCTKSELQL